MMTIRKKISLWLIALVMIFAVIPFSVMWVFQGWVTFPVPAGEGPEGPVGDFDQVEIKTPDGHVLNAWYHEGAPDAPRILVFHGNAEIAANRLPLGEALARAGFGVLLAEYRGYGGSTGSPTQKGVIADGLASYDYLEKISDAPIGILAHSLGTGIAVPVAVQRTPYAVLLEAPFTSLAAIAEYRMGWRPRDFMMKYPFHSDRIIKKVKAPILILHGTEDRVIPFRLGQRLASLAPEGTEFVPLDGAGHNDLVKFGAISRIIHFFQKEAPEA